MTFQLGKLNLEKWAQVLCPVQKMWNWSSGKCSGDKRMRATIPFPDGCSGTLCSPDTGQTLLFFTRQDWHKLSITFRDGFTVTLFFMYLVEFSSQLCWISKNLHKHLRIASASPAMPWTAGYTDTAQLETHRASRKTSITLLNWAHAVWAAK